MSTKIGLLRCSLMKERAIITACPVPSCCGCDTVQHCFGSTGSRYCAPCPVTTQISSMPAFRHQSVTQLIIGLNSTRHSAFGYLDFILVPCPAAKMIAQAFIIMIPRSIYKEGMAAAIIKLLPVLLYYYKFSGAKIQAFLPISFRYEPRFCQLKRLVSIFVSFSITFLYILSSFWFLNKLSILPLSLLAKTCVKFICFL